MPLFAARQFTVVADGANLVIDVPFGELPTLDPSTITAANVTVAGATLTKVGETGTAGTIRFQIVKTGLKAGDVVDATYAGTWSYGATPRVLAADQAIASLGGTFLDIDFSRVGTTALDPASFNASTITLSGAGAAGHDRRRRATLLADGHTVRFYLNGQFKAAPSRSRSTRAAGRTSRASSARPPPRPSR